MGSNPSPNSGLLCAYLLDGHGGGALQDMDGVRRWHPGAGTLWVHLDYTSPDARAWLAEESGIDPVIASALLAEETRPRALAVGEGLLVVLRGVNLNPGADPEDMVSIRLWFDGERIISTRRYKLLAIADLRAAIEDGGGPETPGGFLVRLAEGLLLRMSSVVHDLDGAVDALEEDVLSAESHALGPRLSGLRRQAIMLRRYLAPQREALNRLVLEKVNLIAANERAELREVADRTSRYLEDLDAARERAAVTQEELNSRLSSRMEQRMYLLSMVAAVFLPLGFITGLLGINVGGIPGEGVGWGFLAVCTLLAAVLAGQMLYFRRKGWI
ncbi:zinc transporter ZntB [Thioalbus denitrificans]|uniref:Zinc transporter n=1 Tax=Thioalbus denitrificans TaxID=547122 RepID=A0A369C9A0_9GAMM|nr:zinc transporter ZntB [Thioalbus denitrificans]RCX30303.1 zinc transporter [Thioalbus denitrificans]